MGTPAYGQRFDSVFCDHCALVHFNCVEKSRTSALLFHSRTFSTLHQWRTQPWRCLVLLFPFLLLGIVPWLGVLLQGLWTGVKEQSHGFQPRKLLLVWAVFFFFFFSISGSKLPGYILPIFPALALLIAFYVDQCQARALKIAAILFALLGLTGLLFVNKAAGLGSNAFEIPLYQGYAAWLYVAAGMTLLGGLAAWYVAGKGNIGKDWALILLASAGFIAGQVAFLGHDPWGNTSLARRIFLR
jgi:4-amino-4-deoxy-L-arabinose transferase-like glycosyltransferase